MTPIIKPSSELRKNYNNIAEICRTQKKPVFLTRNGEGDTVLMDMATYSRREEDLVLAERLFEAEMDRRAGIKGFSIDEFRENMQKAILQGAQSGK
ncbi:prevent-host-death protein [Spirochaetia bacterium]|nr:prevent-host-death protein [Spirochaetia bacterium]